MTPTEIAALRRQLGIQPARRGRPLTQYPPALVALIRAMAGAGCPDRIIAAATGRHRSLVARVRARHRIPPGRVGMGRPRTLPYPTAS